MTNLPDRAAAVMSAAIVALVAWTTVVGPPPRWLAWPIFVLIAVVIWASARYLIDGPAPARPAPESPAVPERPNIRTRYSPLADWVPAPDDEDVVWDENEGEPYPTG